THATHDEPAAHAPHESPWVVWVPLVLLAIPSVVIGYPTIGPLLYGAFFSDSISVASGSHPAMTEIAAAYHGPLEMALHAFGGPVFWVALAGFVVAWYFYMRRPDIPEALARRFSGLYRLLDNKYYMDWFNEHVLARGTRLVGTGLWRGGDVGVIDGVVIDGSSRAIGAVAVLSRRLQSGYLYWYALVMIVGVIGLMTWQLWPFLAALLAR
ncbi:MAG: NADH-quinone oxidoreductase subunit L, partial [Caldimonas sp.]